MPKDEKAFDYVKLGPYIESLGGLKSEKTNQRLYKRATGEWITFCDADDWIEPDAIEKMVAAAQREDADCVCCGMLRDWRNGTSVFRPFDEMGPSDTYNAVVNKLFKRNLLENLKMDESVSLGEDLMVSAQAMAKALSKLQKARTTLSSSLPAQQVATSSEVLTENTSATVANMV